MPKAFLWGLGHDLLSPFAYLHNWQYVSRVFCYACRPSYVPYVSYVVKNTMW